MGNLPGKSAEQFSRAWNVFVTSSLCMLFGVGKSLCPGGGGGGTPLYGLYRYVPRNRVGFLEVLDP